MILAGVDEAGRGPLAGPVYAAAVILDPNRPIVGLDDSKKLSAMRREQLESVIKSDALGFCVASASVAEIDDINILQASLLAMKRAVLGLFIVPQKVLVDGNRIPQGLPCEAEAIVGGDRLCAEISAASILAKEARDRYLKELALIHPEYDFEQNKGYPTKAHLAALEKHGSTEHHRKSFGPVKRLMV